MKRPTRPIRRPRRAIPRRRPGLASLQQRRRFFLKRKGRILLSPAVQKHLTRATPLATGPAKTPAPGGALPPGKGSQGGPGQISGPGGPGTTNGPSGPVHTPRGGSNVPNNIVFIDARAAEEQAVQALTSERKGLKKRDKDGVINTREKRRLSLLTTVLSNHSGTVSLDRLYTALRRQLTSFICDGQMPILSMGKLSTPGQSGTTSTSAAGSSARQKSGLTTDELLVASVWGRMAREGIVPPEFADVDGKGLNAGDPVPTEPPSNRFEAALVEAVALFNRNRALFDQTLKAMSSAFDINTTGEVDARDWVTVTETLIDREIQPDDPRLPTLIRSAVSDQVAPAKNKIAASTQILLPNLERETAQEVVQVNLEAAQAIYFASMMDEARIFDVVEKLAELFSIGALSMDRGPESEFLYRYIRTTPERMSAYERRNLFARIFGAPVGDPGATGAAFRAFGDQFTNFIASVSDWYRKNQVESLLSKSGRFVASQEQVRKSGLELAVNLSLYCYGSAWFAAKELQQQISQYIDLLSSEEVKRLYGARDMWQVIDQVSVLEFGRPVNTIRARTMANTGAIILGWLEKNARKLSAAGGVLIDPSDIANPRAGTTQNAINDPTDYDLVSACEQWLAIEGVGEDAVDMRAGASPSAAGTLAPVRVPPAAQEILGAFGFGHHGSDVPQPSHPAPRNGAGLN